MTGALPLTRRNVYFIYHIYRLSTATKRHWSERRAKQWPKDVNRRLHQNHRDDWQRKKSPFVFDPEQQAAFTELKRQLAQAESLGNFDRNAKIEIITDSSPVRADDTSFTISSYDPAQKQSKLNSNLAVIQTWLQVNKLSPNVKKAKYFFIDSHDRLGNLSYSPEISNTYMYLGVDLDESLSYVGLPFRQYKYCQKTYLLSLGLSNKLEIW